MGFAKWASTTAAMRLATSELVRQALDTGNVDLSAIIKDNDLRVRPSSIEKWIDAIDQGGDIKADPSLERIDEKIMDAMADSPSVEIRARDVKARQTLSRLQGEATTDPSENVTSPHATATVDAPLADICRVQCYPIDGDSHHAPISSGTGFRLSSRLVLTCRHVLPPDPATCNVLFKFPEYDSVHLDPNTETPTHAVKVHHATMTAGHVNILEESPQRPEAVEIETWASNGSSAGMNYDSDALDFALLEIDYAASPMWELRLEGTLDNLGYVNLYQFIDQLKRGMPPLFPPTSPPFADELLERSVEVRLITEKLWYRELSGAITRINSEAQRVRHTQREVQRGDSGAPVLETSQNKAQVVAIHHAETEQGGQAIPIGPILEQIQTSSVSQSHRHELISFGWLPPD